VGGLADYPGETAAQQTHFAQPVQHLQQAIAGIREAHGDISERELRSRFAERLWTVSL